MTGSRGAATSRAERKTVLLAEDDGPLRLLYALRLEQAGFDVLAAADGAEALRLWLSAQPPPMILVITDWSMPSIDGLALVRRIRAEAVTGPAVPIVLLSAHPSPPGEKLATLNLHYRSKTAPWSEIEAFLQVLVA